MIRVFVGREDDTEAQRRSREDGGRDWSGGSLSSARQGLLTSIGSLLGGSKWNQSCKLLNLEFLSS